MQIFTIRGEGSNREGLLGKPGTAKTDETHLGTDETDKTPWERRSTGAAVLVQGGSRARYVTGDDSSVVFAQQLQRGVFSRSLPY